MNINAIAQQVGSDSRRAPSAARIAVRATAVLSFALLTAAAAQVKFAVPGTPVPATLQTLVVLIAGVSLGPVLGSASLSLYFCLGAAGYYAFAWTGYGFEALAGPTGGYLAGFLLAQPLLGWITQHTRDWKVVLAAVLAGEMVILTSGALWLGLSLGLDFKTTLDVGVWPFLVGEIVKVALAVPAGVVALRVVRPRLR
jgi:biotin transport system substrate-specific component